METTEIHIPPIILCWTEWYPWPRFLLNARAHEDGLALPNLPGVYEARLSSEETRLTIGRAKNLRMRVKQGLVKGKLPHSAGKDIRANEDTSKVLIRWAETDRPAAAEEELHRLYVRTFNRLPKYTDRT